MAFFGVNWIDLHAPSYYAIAYAYRWGYNPGTFFIIPPASTFVGILAVYLLEDSRAAVAGFLGAVVVILSQTWGWFGYSLSEIGPIQATGIFHGMLALIIGLTVATHFDGLSVGRVKRSQLKLDLRIRVRIFGYLMQSITIMLVSGGLLAAAMVLQVASSRLPEPSANIQLARAWAIGIWPFFFYLGYGMHGLFLLRYYLNIVAMRRRIG